MCVPSRYSTRFNVDLTVMHCWKDTRSTINNMIKFNFERVFNFFVVWWWRLIHNVGVNLIKSFWNLQFIISWSIVSTLDDDVNKDSISVPLKTVTSQGFRSGSIHGRLMCCRDGRGAWRTWTLSSREPCSRMTSTRTPSSCRPCRPAVRNLPDHRYVCVRYVCSEVVEWKHWLSFGAV